MNKRQIGTFFENAACEYLESRGVSILQKNFRCRMGEIDIIGRQGDCVIFFEVKYRSSDAAGDALMAVDHKKQKKICRCAAVYCMQHPHVKEIRYDVIGITDTKIDWIRDAFPHRGYGFY